MIINNNLLLNAPIRQITARVEHFSGNTLAANYSYTDNLKSITVERIGEKNKFFGFGVCQKINIKLIDKERALTISAGDTLKIYFANNGVELNALTTYKVTEVNRDENTNEISITAYDFIKKADGITIAEVETGESYTVAELAESVAAAIGLTVEFININDNSTNTFFADGANFDGAENLREVLNDIAEATQTIYYAAADKLVFKRLDIEGEPVLTIGKQDYITLNSKTNRRLTTIISATELGDNVSANTGSIGSTQIISDNALWELRDDIAELVNNALAAVANLTINQFNCNWRGNYLLEIGDKIALINKEDKQVISYMVNDTLTYSGAFRQVTSWEYEETETETDSTPTNLGEALKQTYAKVDKANKQVDILTSEVSANSSAISALQINTDSINASVMRIQEETSSAIESAIEEVAQLTNKVNAQMTAEEVKIEIQTELANGANKVITTTGYTLDENGLKVSKSNSEMSTEITNDGMAVSNNNSVVLKADNAGVNAKNLRATTYLIIGENSRLEDYGDRTACFWVGG